MGAMHWMLCLSLLAGSALAQDTPARSASEKPIRDIKDVEPGMSRDHVFAGLSDKYDLTRIDDPKSESALAGGEYWGVDRKSVTTERDLEDGAIRFWQGKVSVVQVYIYTQRTGESTRFAEQLLRLLYNRAEPPVLPGELCGVPIRIGISKEELLADLGKHCEVRSVPQQSLSFFSADSIPVGANTRAWCVSADTACSHLVWFEGDTLILVKAARYYTDLNRRSINLPVLFEDRHDDRGGERLEMNFSVGGQSFSITIDKNPGQSDFVIIEQNICCRANDTR